MYKIPNFFKPKYSCELLRVGSDNDGGYVIPKYALKNTNTLLSFGLSDDWTFEKEFQNLTNSNVLCFDHSVNFRFWTIRFIKSLFSIVFLKNIRENFLKLFTFFEYYFFFNKIKSKHIKKYIAPKEQFIFGMNKSDITDLNQIFLEGKYESVFFKIDIEGSEYRILDQLIYHQKKINSLVIEFHDCDLHFNRIKNFIENFDLKLVHLHVNNYCSVNKDLNPSVIELTFSSKKHVAANDGKKIKFPVKNLDQPCDKNNIDREVSFY